MPKSRPPIPSQFECSICYEKDAGAGDSRVNSEYQCDCQPPNELGFPRGSVGKRVHLQFRETWVRFLRWEDPLEKEMAVHSSVLAWRTPWTDPGGLQSMES